MFTVRHCALLSAAVFFWSMSVHAEKNRTTSSTTTSTTTTTTTTDSNHRDIGRRPTSAQEQHVPENLPYWTPEEQRYSIGFERGANATQGMFAQNVITGGMWVTDSIGVDGYFGYQKTADTLTSSTATADNTLTNSRTVTTTFSGTKNPHQFFVGAGVKYRVYQNSWFQFAVGPVAGIVTPGSAEYKSGGSTVETIPSVDTPNNKVLADTTTTTKFSQNMGFFVGPRLSTEFYLKWFPHLAIGMATGVLANFGGTSTTTATAKSRTTQIVDGVEQTPSVDTSTTTVTETKTNPAVNTFGVGGTIFSFTGNFIIRYVF